MALLKIKNLFKYLSIISIAYFIMGCDRFEQEIQPNDPAVAVDRTQVFSMANGSALIDLKSMVSAQGTVRIDIASQPSKGNLTELAQGLLEYTPNQGFEKGRDSFTFSIFSQNNKLLKQDSVIIIVDNDTTGLPCGIYPQPDQFVGNIQSSVVIDVLANDALCGYRGQLTVEIYKENPSYPPYDGAATVLADNTIRYTPRNTFNGYDKIVYKVSASSGDSSVVGFGTVYISPAPLCNFILNYDEFSFKQDSVGGAVHLDVFMNDSLCPGDSVRSFLYGIAENPVHGSASISRHGIEYTLSDNNTTVDSLMYQVCRGQECEVARVRIKIY